ncbi:unnamed protein product, partial [marine sediment metagenome]
TDTATGNVRIDGNVTGEDENSPGLFLTSEGRGNIVVQSAADLVITGVTPSHPTVTQGQTNNQRRVTVAIENRGGSALTLDLASATLDFEDGNVNWRFHRQSGDATLPGNSVASLVYVIDSVTANSGNWEIDASVSGDEDNSGDDRNANASALGTAGRIWVQTKPSLSFTSATVLAPNGTWVNTDQSFQVAIEIKNAGEAQANQVQYNVAAVNGSGPPPVLPLTIPVLTGKSTVADTFDVVAATSPTADEFQMEITSGQDDT